MKKLQFTSIKETCLYVKNLENTRSFYHDTLGLEIISYSLENHIFFRAGRSVLLCFNPEKSKNKTHIPPHFGNGNLHFAFEVTSLNYDASLRFIKNTGIKIEHEEIWNNKTRSFYFRDPDNNCVEIIEEGMWEKKINE